MFVAGIYEIDYLVVDLEASVGAGGSEESSRNAKRQQRCQNVKSYRVFGRANMKARGRYACARWYFCDKLGAQSGRLVTNREAGERGQLDAYFRSTFMDARSFEAEPSVARGSCAGRKNVSLVRKAWERTSTDVEDGSRRKNTAGAVTRLQ